MEEISSVGVDLAKQIFQVHGSAADGRALFRKKFSRLHFRKFIAALPPCTSRWMLAAQLIFGGVNWQDSATTFAKFHRFM